MIGSFKKPSSYAASASTETAAIAGFVALFPETSPYVLAGVAILFGAIGVFLKVKKL